MENMELSTAAKDAATRIIEQSEGTSHQEIFIACVILSLASAGTESSGKEEIAVSLSRLVGLAIKVLAASTIVREQ